MAKFRARATQENSLAILGTAEFRIALPNGQGSRIIRGLCDSGSQLNLITEHIAQQIGIMKVKQRIPITGIGASIQASGYANVSIMHRTKPNIIQTTRVLIVKKITSTIPEAPFDNPFASIDEGELADPNFNQPSRIDALLGIGIWSAIVNERIIRQSLPNQTLLAQLTQLGWVISGQSGKCNLMQAKRCCLAVDNDQLHDYLQRFWTVEAIPARKILSADEQLAEDIFLATHKRDKSGRYIVRIPWKPHALP